MGVLSRIGIALDSDLLERFDPVIGRCGCTNRSEGFRDLILDWLVMTVPANSLEQCRKNELEKNHKR
jgi:metal-responsive CopG/Arc/MetJ family transcriptional regulator